MNHSFRIFVHSFIFIVSISHTFYANFSFTLEYDGQLKCGMDYKISDHSSILGKGSINVGFRYQDTPGTLDYMGHAQIIVSAPHTNPAVDTISQIICTTINKRLDYNPKTIDILTRKHSNNQQSIIPILKAIVEKDKQNQLELDKKQKEEHLQALLALQRTFREGK